MTISVFGIWELCYLVSHSTISEQEKKKIRIVYSPRSHPAFEFVSCVSLLLVHIEGRERGRADALAGHYSCQELTYNNLCHF